MPHDTDGSTHDGSGIEQKASLDGGATARTREQSGFARRGFLKGIGVAGLGVGSVAGFSSPASAESDEGEDVDGDNVYLVFGADADADDLDAWLEDHREQMAECGPDSSLPYLRYQDVSQLNVALQGLAVSISIDGGEAKALQRTYQENTNFRDEDSKDGKHKEKNEEKEQTFTGVGDVYVVFADETEGREFTGWSVSGESYQPEYDGDTEVDQEQEVDQLNFSLQAASIAIAEDGSTSHACQRNYQENENLQAANVSPENGASTNDDGKGDDSSGNGSQIVDQLNVALQGVAIAIAVGEDSVAKAKQSSYQANRNAQIEDGGPVVFDGMAIEEFAANAEMDGDFSDSDGEGTEDGSHQRNEHGAPDGISQFQDVFQANINAQLLALSVALGGSEAEATQASYQGNFNAQILESNGHDVQPTDAELLAVASGESMKDGIWSACYENGNDDSVEEITQVQQVSQLNVNAQLLAIAVAIDEATATAEQLTFQRNENVQVLETDGEDGHDDGDEDEVVC